MVALFLTWPNLISNDLLPHSNVSQSDMTEGVSVVQNTDSQASIGLPARSPAHPPVIRGVAVLGPAHALISGIRQVFANDGPGAESAAFFIVGADKLPHRRSLVHHAFVRRPEGDACRN